jgi:hypothetical protein
MPVPKASVGGGIKGVTGAGLVWRVDESEEVHKAQALGEIPLVSSVRVENMGWGAGRWEGRQAGRQAAGFALVPDGSNRTSMMQLRVELVEACTGSH